MDDTGLYIHWPFCLSKCAYCDFNSHVGGAVDQVRWRRALGRELEDTLDFSQKEPFGSVFFGGGTPSLMEPDTVAELLAIADRRRGLGPNAEVTLEANPTSAEAGRFAAFRDAGVTRLSLGVQALNDDDLGRLGRTHCVRDALQALDMAMKTFPFVSFDLIYARPGQTLDGWREELTLGLGLGAGHMSLYQLSVEPGTKLYCDGVTEADEDTAAELFEVTQELTARGGLPAYEVSNHAGKGLECRHNLAIWRGADYAGVGPGAHGRRTTIAGVEAYHRTRDPGLWLAAVERRGHGTAARSLLDTRERWQERVMLGLRLSEGIDRGLTAAMSQEALAELLEQGLVAWRGDHLATTQGGRLCLDRVLAELL